MSIIHSVTPSRRKDIVQRIRPGQTAIVAASLKDPSELAFAVRFLMDHFTYKRSKQAGVTSETASAAYNAVMDALENYEAEVAMPLGIDIVVYAGEEKKDTPVVSQLGNGKITNPYNFV